MEDLKYNMVRESLARGFKPAGFEQPEDKRDYVKPRRELQKAFYQWVDELPDYLDWEVEYNKVCELISPLGEVSYKEANSLLAGFKPKTKGQKEAGLFISACYTHSPEGIIVFDLDAPEIYCIGYKTNKNIFNNGKVGAFFALESSGLSVNNSECEDYFAMKSSGVVINNGESKSWFVEGSSGIAVNNWECGNWFADNSSGLAITVKEPKSYGRKEESRIIKPADCDSIPELRKYLDELSEISRNIKDELSAKRFLERYGPEPKERIEREIKDILKEFSIE